MAKTPRKPAEVAEAKDAAEWPAQRPFREWLCRDGNGRYQLCVDLCPPTFDTEWGEWACSATGVLTPREPNVAIDLYGELAEKMKPGDRPVLIETMAVPLCACGKCGPPDAAYLAPEQVHNALLDAKESTPEDSECLSHIYKRQFDTDVFLCVKCNAVRPGPPPRPHSAAPGNC